MERVSIRDVAREAGVSITTVSKALNDYPDVNPETRRRIREIAQRMSYVPDVAGRSMGGITEKVIGLLLNDLTPTDPTGAVFGILSGAYHACADSGIDFVLLTTNPGSQEEMSLKRLCLSKRLDGIICNGFRLHDPYLEQARQLDLPCAVIDVEMNDPKIVDVTIDNVQAADEAVTLLLRGGCRAIALINGSARADVSLRRGQGYAQALRRAGLPVRPEWTACADFDMDCAHRAAAGLLRRYPELDAFFCASDVMALGVCQAIEEAGRKVGTDVMVVGFDDIPTARYLYGGLTTVRQDFYKMGYTAGLAVYRRIQGQREIEAASGLMHELIVRGTAHGG